MPIFDAPRSDAGADDGLADEPGRQAAVPSGDHSGLREKPQWLILKRGQERLALFRGWPEPGLALTFRQMAMTVGLALEGRDFAAPGRFDGCGYVYIGAGHRFGAACDDALRDLARAGWAVDRDAAAWPVIDGGFQPAAADDLSPFSPRVTSEPKKRPAQRMEA